MGMPVALARTSCLTQAADGKSSGARRLLGFPRAASKRRKCIRQCINSPDALRPLANLSQLEREKGFEPSTLALARRCSTTELFPRGRVGVYRPDAGPSSATRACHIRCGGLAFNAAATMMHCGAVGTEIVVTNRADRGDWERCSGIFRSGDRGRAAARLSSPQVVVAARTDED